MEAADVSALVAYAGTHEAELIWTLLNGFDIANDIRVIPQLKSKHNLPKLTVGDGARPYSSTTEFKTGDLQYTDRTLEVRVGKRELLIDIEDYRGSYLEEFLPNGALGAKGQQNQNNIPFAAWTFDKVSKKIAQEINDKTAYNGFLKSAAVAFDAGDAYAVGDYVTFTVSGITEWFKCVTITTAGQTPLTHAAKWQNVTAEAIAPGIKYHLDAAITAGDIVETSTGVVNSASTALEAFKKLYRSAPVAFKNNGIVIHAPYTDYEYLLDGIEDKLSKYTREDVTPNDTTGGLYLPGTNRKCIVKPASWLGTSRRMIAEPWMMQSNKIKGSNLVMGMDMMGDMNTIATKANLWGVEVGYKIVIGFQICDTDALWVGNQA